METGLEGKRVLVTGASGGIGAACARAFAAEGAQVVVHHHLGRERAEAVASEIGGELAAAVAMDDDLRTLGSERTRTCRADASGGSGDENALPRQPGLHLPYANRPCAFT